jgi:hypothetical protein
MDIVFVLLAASPAVTAIIGTNPVRCYEPLIPQTADGQPNNTLLPAVTWQLIIGTPETYIAAPATISRQRIQVDALALTRQQAKQLLETARTALEDGGRNVCVNENGCDYEPDTKRYRASADFEFWVAR